MNLKINQFEQDLVDLVNRSDIPIIAKRAILESTLYKVVRAADKVLLLEVEELNKQNEKPEPITEEGNHAEST